MKINRALLERLDGQLRDETQALLAKYQQIGQNNPLVGYTPHPKQAELHSSKKRTRAFLGGNQSGKTTMGVVDDIIQAVDLEAIPPHLRAFKKFEPPFLCRIICPDYVNTMEGVIFHKIRDWCPKDQLVGDGWGKAFEKSTRKLRFKNGSEFDFLSYEQDIDKFGGATRDRIHYDEEPPQDIWEQGRLRLMARGGDELFTMTPENGLSWMYDQIWVPWTKGRLQNATVLTVDMDENPYLDRETREWTLATMSKDVRRAKKEGKFVHFAGAIYEDFDRNRHVIPEITEIPKDASVYVGIDPGHRHMCAVLWTYLTPENELVTFDELALQGHTIPQVCEAIKLVNVKWSREISGQKVPLTPSWYVIDPSAKNILHQTGRSDQMEFTKHGVVTIPGQNAVGPGIDRVRWRLENDKLHIGANCTHLIDEFPKYRWKSETRTEDQAKEEPIKRDDHLLDALRYVVMSEPYANRSREPEEFMEPLKKAMREEVEGLRPNQIPSRAPEGGVFA